MSDLLEKTIAIFGAGGKMGCRIADNFRNTPYKVLYVEVAPAGVQRLTDRGLKTTPHEEAVAKADVAILALPDSAIGAVARTIVPGLKPGAMVICLDPAAPHGGQLPARADICYFITHPCHPPVIHDETEPAAQMDFFGGIAAKQHIVCALMQGPEENYPIGERICREMFAPVMNSYRVTVEQMAILEPALSETVAATCMTVIREAIDEAARRGVPEEAARQFILGHIKVNIGILFGYIGSPFSDGALLAIDRGKKKLFQPDWKSVFEPENVMAEVQAIVNNPGRAEKKAS